MTDLLAGDSYRRDRTSAADQVLDDLRSHILSGRLARGTRLPSEKELAAQYQVSPPTIREAVRALSAMSLVEVRHGSGTFVIAESAALLASAMNAVIELEDIDLPSILDVSEAVYAKAVELGIREATDEELVALRATADRFTRDMDNAEFVGALREFLMSLVAISHNRLLIIIAGFLVESQISRAEEVAARSPSVWGKIAGQLIKERVAIADALAARDDSAAQAAVRRYIKRGDDLVRKHAVGR
jgi:GntR family transcriptional repressor for pyruvate dehydrogenase complex